ncbi:hypothetical protein O0L34_g7338 [Tuta absoluta]|nr:hypothetical protein O0L34_g7338 [Tuta absoluta]
MKSMTPANICSAFQATGIYPYSRDIFTDIDFAPSEVTDRPLQETDAPIDNAACTSREPDVHRARDAPVNNAACSSRDPDVHRSKDNSQVDNAAGSSRDPDIYHSNDAPVDSLASLLEGSDVHRARSNISSIEDADKSIGAIQESSYIQSSPLSIILPENQLSKDPTPF